MWDYNTLDIDIGGIDGSWKQKNKLISNALNIEWKWDIITPKIQKYKIKHR